ncbi:MAG: hypothetical protein K9L88_21640 [Chromatiaceae bacterium]|nr:hypothetical protein [Chromatiaceae bacterium]
MHKRLTMTLDEPVYKGLHRRIGKRRISQFIEVTAACSARSPQAPEHHHQSDISVIAIRSAASILRSMS